MRGVISMAAVGAVVWAASAEPVPVLVERGPDGGWRMMRGGEPYFVRGAGGTHNLEALVAAGGNSVRTWGTDDGKRVLDEAAAHGLTVTMGIWVPHPRHGFDWTDRSARAAEMAKIRREVEALKDHPALLAWGVGNEVEHEAEDRLDLVLGVIEEAAAVVKAADPNHPTIAVVAGAGHDKVARLAAACPSVDMVGVNSYGGAGAVPEVLTKQGYDGPYMITEFGPRGWWESPATPWGAPIEPTSAEKAETYSAAYAKGVGAEIGKRCLGSYVFLWAWKQETTSTWFGMFLESGERTPTVDAMQHAWTGAWPADRAPEVRGVEGLTPGAEVKPGVTMDVRAVARDPEGREVVARWQVVRESTDRRTGGDPEAAPPMVDVPIKASGLAAKVTAPSEAGHYRLFLFVSDGSGAVGTTNIPFAVVRR